MIITHPSKTFAEQPESGESYMSFGNMNIDDFILPEVPTQEDVLGEPSSSNFHQSVSSTPGATTAHYGSSPAPSGTSTPVINNPAHSSSTHFSPTNMPGASPRQVQSPMVCLSVPSPSGGNGTQNSRPASQNSAHGIPPMSPYGQTAGSPKIAVSQSHPSNPYITPPPTSSMRSSLMSTLPTTQVISTAAAKLASSVAAQSQSMMTVKVNEGTGTMKRSPVIPTTTRLPHMTTVGDPRMMHSTRPVVRRIQQPLQQVGSLRMSFTRSPSYRIYELNRRLQERNSQGDSVWWDYFVCEFFEDNATISLSLCLEDGPRKFELGRTLIPRFFRSFYEGGAVELFFNLRQTKEWYQNNCFVIDSEACAMETLYVNPIYTKVISEGRLVLEFVPNEMMRIKSWHFAVRGWQEQIPRSALSFQAQQQNPALTQQWTVNITRHGFPGTTLSYLKMCCILQPMQHLMTMHKASGMDPRECLQKTLVHKWQTPEERPTSVTSQEPAGCAVPKQRKKRKTAAEKNNRSTSARKKRSPEPLNIMPMLNQAEMMVVGEPSLMGGALGKDDERHITRIENMQLAAARRAGNGTVSEGPWMLHDVLASTLPDFGESSEE